MLTHSTLLRACGFAGLFICVQSASAADPPAADALTEFAAAQWSAAAQGATSTVADDTSRFLHGSSSLRYTTTGGFDTWLWSPSARNANWDFTYVAALRFSVYAENPSPYLFQNASPWIRFGTGPSTTNYWQFQAAYEVLNPAVGNWIQVVVPLSGDLTWARTQVGSPSWTDIDYIEIHADTWDAGFTLWFDGLAFDPLPYNPTGLAAIAGDGVVTLTWDAYTPRPDFDYFAIYRSTAPFTSVAGMTPIATVSNAAATTYDDLTVVNGTAYHYAITAVATDGTEDEAVTSVGPRVPGPAGQMQLTPFYTTMHVQWDAVSNPDLAGYEIYRRTVGGSYPPQPLKRVLVRNDFTDYGLTPGQTYFYKAVPIDGAGNAIAQATVEASATLDTSPAGYSVHKNFEVLIAFYTGGYTAAQVDATVEGLKRSLEFYWRTSETNLNMDVTWLFIPLDTPGTATGWGDAALMNDLRARGVQDDQYDLAYLVGRDLAGCFGGYIVFGSTCAALGTVCGVAYPENLPGVDYTIAWTFTHEIHHALEAMENITPTTPEVVFCHYPWAYPSALGPTGWHLDFGPHYDGIAVANRDYGDDWLLFPPPYDGYIECIDEDGDGLPDADDRVWKDEARFGTDPGNPDTDGDLLDDRAEYSAGNFRSSDPHNGDTDGDGLLDGEDHQPLFPVPPYIPRMTTPPVMDGQIEGDWRLLREGYYYTHSTSDFGLRLYAGYDADNLYIAFAADRRLRYMISLDGSGLDGRFESPVRHVSGATDTYNDDNKGNHIGDSWGDGNHLYTFHLGSTLEVYGRGVVPGAQVVSTGSTAPYGYQTEIRIPRVLPGGSAYTWYPPDAPVVDGLTLAPGHVIGLNVTVSNLVGSSGAEFSGTWTSLFEPHSFVDFTLQLLGDHDIDGDFDLADFAVMQDCLAEASVGGECGIMDLDGDGDVDLGDYVLFEAELTGPQ